MRKSRAKGLAELVKQHLHPTEPLRVFANAVPPSLMETLESDLGTPRENIKEFPRDLSAVRVPSTTPFDFLINGSHSTFDLVVYYAQSPAELLDVTAVLAAREMLAGQSVVHLQTSIPFDHRYRLQFVSKLREYTSLEPHDFEDVDSFDTLFSAFRGGLVDAVHNPADLDYSSVADLLSAGVAHIFQQGRLNFHEPAWMEKHPFRREVRRDVGRVLAMGTPPDFVMTLFDVPQDVDEILASGRYSKTWLDGNLGGIASNIAAKLGQWIGHASDEPAYEPDDRLAMKLPRSARRRRRDEIDERLRFLAVRLAMIAHEQERRGYWATSLTRLESRDDDAQVVADTFCLEHCDEFLSRRPLLQTVDGQTLPRVDGAIPDAYFDDVLRAADGFIERFPPARIRSRCDSPGLRAARFDNGYLPPRVRAETTAVDRLEDLGFTREELGEYFRTPPRHTKSAVRNNRAG